MLEHAPVLLHFLELICVDHIGRTFVLAGGFMIFAGHFIFFVASEAVFLDIFIRQFALGRALGVFGRQVGCDKDLTHGISSMRVGLQRRVRHSLNDFKAVAICAAGQDFLI